MASSTADASRIFVEPSLLRPAEERCKVDNEEGPTKEEIELPHDALVPQPIRALVTPTNFLSLFHVDILLRSGEKLVIIVRGLLCQRIEEVPFAKLLYKGICQYFSHRRGYLQGGLAKTPYVLSQGLLQLLL